MKRGRKYEIMTGSSVSEAMKLTNIQIASSPPMRALNRMLEKVHSAVLPTMATAVKLTAFPDVTSASRIDLELSIREALVTSGKAVSFTAVAMVGSTALWTFSNIRFNALMGGLLAIWMFVSFIASETLLPVMISYFRPRFILREASKASRRPAVAAQAAAVS